MNVQVVQLSTVACPACGAERTKDAEVYNGYRLKKCMRCAFIFTAERQFAPNQYENVYCGVGAYKTMLDDARKTFEGQKGYRDLWWYKKKALRWLGPQLSGGKLLDVGSGPGTFLIVAKREYHFHVQGIEPASAAAKVANDFGISTYCGTVEEFEKHHTGKFDAITSFEVLEHVPEPLSVVTVMRRLITKSGILIISVPNLDDPYCLRQQITPAMPPIHINFFSRSSLKALLNRAGFELTRSFTLPIPSSSVRNVHRKAGFLIRLPALALRSLVGLTDGTTLLVMATPRV